MKINTFIHLGIPCSFNLNNQAVWKSLITKFKNNIQMFKQSFALSSKVAILKSYIIPTITYEATFLDINDERLQMLEKEINQFLWNNNKRTKVSKKHLTSSQESRWYKRPRSQSNL
jgi:hypothetical protein